MSSPPTPKNSTTHDAKGFDYSTLDIESRQRIQQQTADLKSLIRRSAQDIISIGAQLIEAKAALGHGNFEKWLKAEFSWSIASAKRFIQVADNFKSLNLSDLNFATSALYLLAKPSVPEEARKEAITRAVQGENITLSKANEIVSRQKGALKQTEPSLFPKAESVLDTLDNGKTSLRPEHAIVEVEAETMPDDSPQNSIIPDLTQFNLTYTVGDHIRILRRQMGQDEWCGKIAQIWNIADDGWLRVGVEGHPGVRFTLHPTWVEPVDDITREANMSESAAHKISNHPIRVQLPIEIEGQKVNVEGIVTAVDVSYTLNGQSHQINLPADKIVFPC